MDAQTHEKYYVYLAQCASGVLYVGSTKNVSQRIAAHNAGRGGRYTRINRPLKLLRFWTFNTRTEARVAEYQMKRLSPSEKLAVFCEDQNHNK